MTFKLNTDVFLHGANQQNQKQNRLFDSIARGLAYGQRKQAMDMRERQLAAKANDPKKLAEAGMMKAAQGLPIPPQEHAAMKVWQAQQRPTINPTTGEMLGAPDIFKSLNIGGGQQAPMEQPSQQPPTSSVLEAIIPQVEGKDPTGMANTPKGQMKQFETNEAIRKKKGEANIEAQKKLDEKFINDVYVPFKTGGFADNEKQLNQINEVKDSLKEKNITGGLKGYLPTAIRGMNPAWEDSVDAQEKVEEVVQRNLREVLGAQFTEKEGERLISRAYNPRLSEEVNKSRVDALHKAMSEASEAKKSAIEYFENNGTLNGWEGVQPSHDSINDRFDELTKGNKTPKKLSDMTVEERKALYEQYVKGR
jgi:hypothetical protein